MSPNQPVTRQDLADQLQPLAFECYSLDWFCAGKDAPLSSQEAAVGLEQFNAVAKNCQTLFIQAQGLFSDFQEMDAWGRASNLSKYLDDYVIPFALGLESDLLTRVSRWVGDGLQVFHFLDDHPSKAAMMTRRLSMRAPYPGNHPGTEPPLTPPAFFYNGQFRHAFLHKMMFRSEVDKCIHTICEGARQNVVQAAVWINTIHKAADEHPATGEQIKELIGEHLMSTPVEGLEALREYILGRHAPSGLECSERATKLFGGLVYRQLSPDDISSQLSMLRLNDRYFTSLFLTELNRSLVDSTKHFDNNERGDEYDAGPQGARQFKELFDQLALSAQDLAVIAMSVAGKYSPGKQMDLMELPVADQVEMVLADVHRDSMVTVNPEGNLRHSVLSAILKAMPVDLVSEISQKSDASRMLTYKLTGQKSHLRGLQNKKLLDSVMGSDLGL
ncbi:hypothetical protein [Pseudomonas amygdali]|uniref:Uncharacterized protein n=2 Tax=Pseudomonas amygdali pv. lachrymans TaxID=53707 RepID=A0ABR5KQM6_PSEAV|nr:hypothetical protein [Pseudomonas amygdali]AXH59646.1 hypothetical protein PLA107_030955 [Pseudomonas amygdali pv. lachrymans str. M301315]KPC17074.1 Uncharacterized protein AC499_0276 [Pseudomonas amygdali pv. lachrymans]KPC18033.1 Uncharacterized protein AC499_1235 [Pseudomonas amygdali pv. lachrymans]RMT06151.1 hypothetical protein ALP54_102284 [Pseudomonas amygdali pv. lachrymans]